jgi:hypothetical protein
MVVDQREQHLHDLARAIAVELPVLTLSPNALHSGQMKVYGDVWGVFQVVGGDVVTISGSSGNSITPWIDCHTSS